MRLFRGVLPALILGMLAAGCSNGGGASTGELTGTVELSAVIDLSGPAGLAGNGVKDGLVFWLAEIIKSEFLAGTTLTIDFNDTQSDREQAASLMSRVIRSQAPVVFGPVSSSSALAAAPIAQREGLPYIATQSQTDGIVETGDFVYRLTAPQRTFQNKTADFLKKEGVKTVALVHLEEGAANAEWSKKVMPAALKDAGLKVVDRLGVTGSQTDFSALATRLRRESPDAIGVSVIGSQNSTLVNQIRQLGFTGTIFGDLGFAGGTLEAAGDKANGVVFATDFAPFLDVPSSQKFTEAWTNAKDSQPQNFNAEGYDAIWFVARALKETQSTDRDRVRDAMKKVSSVGFEGAAGQISFEGRDERVTGTVVQWKDGQVVALP